MHDFKVKPQFLKSNHDFSKYLIVFFKIVIFETDKLTYQKYLPKAL